MITLQLMLMQCDGKRILLLPAWPAEWTADFKLHAPYQTTVEGHVENGKITNLLLPTDQRGTNWTAMDPIVTTRFWERTHSGGEFLICTSTATELGESARRSRKS